MSGVSRQARSTIAETLRRVSRAGSSNDSTPLIASSISVQVLLKIVSSSSSLDLK